MRMLVFVALVLSGCGPMQVAGNWSITVLSAPTCRGTMGLRQAGESFDGVFACTDANGWDFQGTVTGALRGDSVSMDWASPGFKPSLVTATATDDRHMNGTLNGSGFSGEPFGAIRQ